MTISSSVSGRWQYGFWLTLNTCFWWGLLPITLKGVLPKLDPITLTFFRFAVTFVLLFLFVYWQSKFSFIHKLKDKAVFKWLVFAAVSICLNYIFYIMALERMSPSGAQVLIQIAPVLFLLSGIFLFKESFSLLQCLGVATFISGLLLFFNLRLQAMFDGVNHYSVGMAMMVLAAIFWALYAVFQKKIAHRVSSVHIMLFISFCGCLVFLPLSEPALFFTLNRFEGFLLLLCGLNTLLAYGSFAESLNHWEASRISAMVAIAPILTLIFVQLLQIYPIISIEPEPLNTVIVIGAVLVVIGAAIASLASKSSNK